MRVRRCFKWLSVNKQHCQRVNYNNMSQYLFSKASFIKGSFRFVFFVKLATKSKVERLMHINKLSRIQEQTMQEYTHTSVYECNKYPTSQSKDFHISYDMFSCLFCIILVWKFHDKLDGHACSMSIILFCSQNHSNVLPFRDIVLGFRS